MTRLKNSLFKRHYDKTVAFVASVIVLILFAPAAFFLYSQMTKNYHENIVSMADIGAEQAERALDAASNRDVNIWDTDYQEIGFEEFKEKYCVRSGVIDREYFEWLAGGVRTRYHTKYDENPQLQKHVECIQRSFRNADPFKIRYAELIDRNGYVPWHGYAQLKCTGNREWDIRNSRQKRVWKRELFEAQESVTNKRRFIHVTDFGEQQNIAASPVMLSGKIWGWFLVAYYPYDVDYRLAAHLFVMMLISALLVGAVFHVYVLRSINKIYDAQMGGETHC